MAISQPDLSIIVISFNQSDLVCRCLDSVTRMAGDIEYEIILVDNASKDGTVEVVANRFPSVTILLNDRNRGFAAANNQGIRVSHGRYLFLLNQDAEIVEGNLGNLVHTMDDYPEIGVLGCKVILPDGVLQPTCAIYDEFPTLWNMLFPNREKLAQEWRLLAVGRDVPERRDLASRYVRQYRYDHFHEVHFVSGVAMVARRAMCDKVGLLDEHFFMYNEDLDWCLRALQAGWKIFYTPVCTICHQYYQGGMADPRLRSRLRVAEQSRLHYFRKHRPSYESVFLALGLFLSRLSLSGGPVLRHCSPRHIRCFASKVCTCIGRPSSLPASFLARIKRRRNGTHIP